ncbi:MAG: hypothetical protein WC940_02090 [Candidatus Paceibacterota bacterium]|jgi:hypothetical protein
MTEKPLTNLEYMVLKGSPRFGQTRFIVCALRKDGNCGGEYDDIDCIKVESKQADAWKLKKKMQKEFPNDRVRVLLSKVIRIA